jgi:phosphopantetheine adenylyltransferase
MAAILKIDQAIFLQSPLLIYLVPTTPNGIGIPLTIESSSPSALTTTTYSGLIVLDPTGSDDCVVFTTQTLINFGQRTSTGLFEMTDTLPIVVIDADPSILPTLSYSQVVEALQSCASANDNHTVNCQAFDDLSVFLRKNFGIKNITPTVAACFYEYFNENANRVIKPVVEKEEPVVYLPVNEPSISVVLPTTVNEISKVKTEVSVVLPTTVVEPTKEKTLINEEPTKERTLINEERAYPFEPFEPFEPLIALLESDRDIKVEKVPEPVVRHIEDSATTTTTSITESSSNDAIEAKLRALLEATETSEVSRTE